MADQMTQVMESMLAGLESYKAAFNTLHTFVAGLSLAKHERCSRGRPLLSGEVAEACLVCEAEALYHDYAWLALEQTRRIQPWYELPKQT